MRQLVTDVRPWMVLGGAFLIFYLVHVAVFARVLVPPPTLAEQAPVQLVNASVGIRDMQLRTTAVRGDHPGDSSTTAHESPRGLPARDAAEIRNREIPTSIVGEALRCRHGDLGARELAMLLIV